MRKHLALCITLGLLAGFIPVEAQKKTTSERRMVVYTAPKGHSRLTAQIAVQASTDRNFLLIYCDPQTHSGPCAVASSTIPPGIPKCIPDICHGKLLFIREMDGKYRLEITIDGKTSTAAVKTNGPEFNRKMSAFTKIPFSETRGR